MVTHDRIRLTGLLRKTLANAGVFYMTFRYGIVTVRVRQPLGGFTGTARGGPPAVALRLFPQRPPPPGPRYHPAPTLPKRLLPPLPPLPHSPTLQSPPNASHSTPPRPPPRT